MNSEIFTAHRPWAEKLSCIPVSLLLGEAVCRLMAGRWLLFHLENNAVQYLLRRGSKESKAVRNHKGPWISDPHRDFWPHF